MTETQTTAEAMEADILSRAELRADGLDRPAPPKARKPKSPAEWAYQRVVLYLKAFEETLDEAEEAAMGFADGAGGVLRIQGIGFHAPDIVTFSGTDGAGHRCQLIQHVSQLNVMMRAVPRPEDRPEPRRIGFALARALEDDEAAEEDLEDTGAETSAT
ncbi:MAG: hypothetical protein AAF390_00280 [Pseudomonadota bacterium]